MGSIKQLARSKLAQLEIGHLRRRPVTTTRGSRGEAQRMEQGAPPSSTLSFSCNDYLGLSQHPALKRAAVGAIETYGTGAGASRLVTGNHPLYARLEERLARFTGREAACVFGSGYLTNLGVIPAFIGAGDLFLVDELSHACVLAGGRQARATQLLYRHADVEHCEELLERHRGEHRRCLIATDSVFSMDGDRAPLAELSDLARRHGAWLLVDDAHGLGLLSETQDSHIDAELYVGTLSKALGSYGGFVGGSREVIDLLFSRARSLIYSTALPPANLASALAALDLIEAERDLRARPVARAREFAAALGWPRPDSAIVPWILGSASAALEASERLARGGLLAVAIRPPTVPEGTARLRFSFSALHTPEHVSTLVRAVRALVGSS